MHTTTHLHPAYIGGTLHIAIPGAHPRGGALYVPAPGLTPTPGGNLRVRAMGTRPPLRACRPGQPQVQACRVPSAHPASRAAMGAPGTW